MGSLLGAAPKGAPAGPASTLINAFPLIFLFAIFYFLIFRPQRRQENERRRMVENLKVGDRVLTQGGIYGTITSIKEQSILLRIADNVKVEVARSAVTQLFNESSNGSTKPPATASIGDRNS